MDKLRIQIRILSVIALTASFLGLSSAALATTTTQTSAAFPTRSSCATPNNNSTLTTCFFDLTASGSSTQTPASAVLNGGIFRVPGQTGDTLAGTGVYQPFVRIQEGSNGTATNGIEAGFNTDGSSGVGQLGTELDNYDKGGSAGNHSIKLSDIPTVTVCDGGGATGSNCKQYFDFLLDTNEQGNSLNSGISMDEFKVFTAATGNIVGATGTNDTKGITNTQLPGATLRYDMDAGPGGDASILTNFSGSVNGVDLQALVPVTNFAGVATDSFVYLYSKFGWTAGQCQATGSNLSPCMQPDGTTGIGSSVGDKTTNAGSLNFSADTGFEEWSIGNRIATHVQAPLPSTLLLIIGAGLGMSVLRRPRRNSRRTISGP